MKRQLLLLVVVLLSVTVLFAQELVVEDFDEAITDTIALSYNIADNADSDSCYTKLSWIDSEVYSGAKALQVDYRAQNSESWGGYSKFMLAQPDSTKNFDFSGYDSLSIMYYVKEKQSIEGSTHFRLNLDEVSEFPDKSNYELYYSFHYILDSEPGWNEIKIELVSNDSWDGTGFNQTGWAGVSGNQVIDKDKIDVLNFEFSIGGSGTGESSYGSIIFDHMVLKGQKKIDVVFFNGKALPGDITLNPGWDGSAEVTDEEDAADDGTNSIKWSAGAQWSGPFFEIASTKNLGLNWPTDSIQFKIKADAGVGDFNLVFVDNDEDGGDADDDFPFEATYALTEADMVWDGTWKPVKIALTDFNRNAGVWWGDHSEAGVFDTTRVNKFGIVSSTANAAGNVIYFDDMWVGNPEFDWVPPEQVASVSATGNVTASGSYNLVMWQDVEGETDEVYNVYASSVEFSDVTDPTVELVSSKVASGTQLAIHYTRYPLVDHSVNNYYAVTCVDAAGNEGEPTFSGLTTTEAKGIPTISLNVPENLAIDGYFDEWYDSGIKPWVIKPETDKISVGTVTDSTDFKATVWLAIDDDFLYLAGEIIDDAYYSAESNSWWCNDAFDFCIGLYNQVNAPHSSFEGGEEPDHKFQVKATAITDEKGGEFEYENGSENYYFEGLNPDYVFEAKISLDDILGDDETRFHPKNGMKIPIELYFHDNDEGSVDHESAIGWSPLNNDNAHVAPSNWAYTFIGDEYGYVAIDDEENMENVITEYSLNQNYPNPFNPTTTISYALPVAGDVKLTVYNMLGQSVTTLVNKSQNIGKYSVKWNASQMPSGIYFYHIQTDNFSATKKMLFVK